MDQIFALDFDGTFSDRRYHLSYSSAEKIAQLLLPLQDQIFIISFASVLHIFNTIQKSQSLQLLKLFKKLQSMNRLYTMETFIPGPRVKIIPKLHENGQQRQAWIRKLLMEQRIDFDRLEEEDLFPYLMAYKKCRILKNLSDQYHIAPNRIYFFEDNPYNYGLAKSQGYHAVLVDNSTKMTFLHQLKKLLSTLSNNTTYVSSSPHFHVQNKNRQWTPSLLEKKPVGHSPSPRIGRSLPLGLLVSPVKSPR